MKKTILCSLAVGLLSLSGSLTAQERPFEASLFHPIQIYDENTDIRGLRLNLFYARNNNITGVDFGFLGLGRAHGDFKGVSLNFVGSIVEGDMIGWQNGIYTHTQGEFKGFKQGLLNRQGGDFKGLQYGAVNLADSEVRGVQLGLYNQATDVEGVQLGFVNYTEHLHGLQIGLANINAASDPFYFFPFVNFSF